MILAAVQSQELADAVGEVEGVELLLWPQGDELPDRADEIEFLRWRADRWIKLKHLPVALVHTPLFAVRSGLKMLRYTFRGTTIRSILGLEDERKSFERYRALRRAERVYL